MVALFLCVVFENYILFFENILSITIACGKVTAAINAKNKL